MDDPFECRLNFLSLLEKLNASQQSIQKVANYAVRHRNLAEDLYSCLLEQLDKATINARVNIVYVLDAIFAISHKAGFKGYHDLTRQDLPRIIETVVPNDAKGNVNIGSTRKILNNWRRRRYFETEVLDVVEKPLLQREAAAAESSQTAGDDGFSKEDIMRRMEEDRERHKRFREEVWIRSAEESVDAEFQQLWESTEPLVPDTDYEVMMLQNMLRLPHYAWHMMLSQRSSAVNTMAPPPPPPPPPAAPAAPAAASNGASTTPAASSSSSPPLPPVTTAPLSPAQEPLQSPEESPLTPSSP
ncbi:CTD kinase subunit gamma CTK3-domain-containing protein [Zychaea mexicana]|uniref:CTD kinase subunit gamma CTK3-domain-containing protein n=1 Tax=Zychaea mexicana TaxID=64656 RepID=UPI0022FE99DD|nr:CTD kinase subunit gamma CTK3-domain-containing protein [Zychaea mexicana]KAI9484321.1 CTD kinase subunit gamma CTK3-domain-containing protein [Zychaea mexicana]